MARPKIKRDEKINNLKKQAAMMKAIRRHGLRFIVRPVERSEYVRDKKTGKTINIPQPAFNGLNQALCGIIRKGETLKSFREKWIKQKSRWIKNVA